MQNLPATVSVSCRLYLIGDEFVSQNHVNGNKYRVIAHQLADLHSAWQTLNYQPSSDEKAVFEKLDHDLTWHFV